MPSVSHKPRGSRASSTAPALSAHDGRAQTWLEEMASTSHCTRWSLGWSRFSKSYVFLPTDSSGWCLALIDLIAGDGGFFLFKSANDGRIPCAHPSERRVFLTILANGPASWLP